MAMLSDFRAYLNAKEGEDLTRRPDFALEETKGQSLAVRRDAVGRPTHMTMHVMAKLEFAYKVGCDDRLAASFAGIGFTTLTAFLKKHPKYRELTFDWQKDRIVRAKATLARAAAVDPVWAKYVVEMEKPRGKGAFNSDHLPNVGGFDFILGVRKVAQKYEHLEPGTTEEDAEAGAIDAEFTETGGA